MKLCFHINRRLSAYCDEELSAGERRRIEAHLKACARCRTRYARLLERIQVMRRLPLLDPADRLWLSIEKDLPLNSSPDSLRTTSLGRSLASGQRLMFRAAAGITALVVIIIALSLASRYGLLPGSHRGELNLASYLDQVSTVVVADTTLREFPAAQGFRNVSWPEARAAVNFPSISPESLPGGYVLTAVRLYTGEDFSALQLKYRSEQGGLCVFQSPANLKLSFGNRQSERCAAGGVQCRRTSSPGCHTYGFTLGDTRCVVMTVQTDQAAVDELIKAFNTEYEKIQQQRR